MLGMECGLSHPTGRRHAHESVLPSSVFPSTHPQHSTHPPAQMPVCTLSPKCLSAPAHPHAHPSTKPLAQGPGSQEAPVRRADKFHLGVPNPGAWPVQTTLRPEIPTQPLTPEQLPLPASLSDYPLSRPICLSLYLSLPLLAISPCVS